jgi:hypothetical protein
MLAQPIHKEYVQCITAGCKGDWRVDHLKKNPPQTAWWMCDECGYEFKITPRLLAAYDIEATGKSQTPTTVTLVYDGTAPIIFRLNAFKYPHEQDGTWVEYRANQKHFYEEHTCPTNWFRDVVQIEIEGDKDPHGAFKLVSTVYGHLKV